LVILVLAAVPAFASHGWGSYHWGRPCSNCAVSLTVNDSTVATNTDWPAHLNAAVFGDGSNPNSNNRGGWNDSIALTLSISSAANDATTRSNCSASNGTIHVCNYTYGNNGWLGLASINTVSGSAVHIAWGVSQVNDTYFSSGYVEPEKRHVMCQEVGHTFGLGHTSEDGSSQDTCMDYYFITSENDWTSTGPNSHDFDYLLTQMHWGSKIFVPAEAKPVEGDPRPTDFWAPWQWGTPQGFDANGRASLFKLDLGQDKEGNEHAIWTRVIWAEEPDSKVPKVDRRY
jgi:hypothetical protein